MKKLKEILKPFITCTLIGALIAGLTLTSKGQFNSPSPTPAYTAISNFTTVAAPSYGLVLTNAAKIARVQIAAGASPVVIDIYDNNITNFQVTNAAYATLTNYTSNVVYTSVSPLTGITNIQTNLSYVTATVTNAAATNIPPYRSFVAAANTLATYDVDMLQVKGIAYRVNTNNGGTLLITYRPND